MPPGAPPKYRSAKKLQEAVDEYFKECEKGIEVEIITKKGDVVKINRPIPMSVVGLAVHLGFASRFSIYDYKNDRGPAFSHIITRAISKIEQSYIEHAMSGQADPKFTQFIMQCGFDYVPKQAVEHDLKGEIKHSHDLSDDLKSVLDEAYKSETGS